MSVEEHVWIRCDYPSCEARTPDHADRLEARRWADDHGWMHQHPSRDFCPEHANNESVTAMSPPQRPTGSMLEDGGGYWSEEARTARLDTALNRIFQH